MKKIVLILSLLCVPAWATNYYVTQGGLAACAAATTSLTPMSVVTYNSCSLPTGGDTVHFIGTITSSVSPNTGGTGTGANNLTLDFTGATLTDGLSATVALSHSHLTLLGGTINSAGNTGTLFPLSGAPTDITIGAPGQGFTYVGSSPSTSLVDVVTNSNGAISNITLQYNSFKWVAHCINFFQNVIITNITVLNNYCYLTQENTLDDDNIQIAAGVNVLIQGNFLQNNSPGNGGSHQDVIQTYCPNSCSGAANPSKWTIRYNYIKRGESSGAGGNMSWDEIEGLVGSTVSTSNCSGATWSGKWYGNVFSGGTATWVGGNGLDINTDELNQSATDQNCVFNNTFWIHADPINPFRANSGPGKIYMENNAYGADASGCVSSGNCPGITMTAGAPFDYNYFKNWNGNCSSTFSGTHGTCSATFNFTNTAIDDFSTTAGSQLINGGDSTIGSEYAFGICAGATWPNPNLCARGTGNWDAGAYQTSSGTVATPTFSPVAGTYNGTQTVAITSLTAGATLCSTVDGSTPTASAGTCTHGATLANGGSISVAVSETVQAIGTLSGSTNSAVASAAYVINPTLTIIISGLGTETSTPAGIACPPTCSASFTAGTNVTLASSAGLFNTWTGACHTQGASCTLTLATSVSSTAKFGCGAPSYLCSSQATTNPPTLYSPVSSTNPSGLVNTSNSAISTCAPTGSQACVQWSNGALFSTGWPLQNVLINGSSFSVASWISTTLAKINQGAGATPGTLTNATYAMPSVCLGNGCQNSTFHGPLNPASLDCATIVTDGSVFNNAQSIVGTPSQGDNDIMSSVNETYLGASNTGGGTGIFHMTMVNNCWQVLNTGHVGIAITDKFGGFSKVTDTRFYYIKGLTQLWQGDITSDSTYTATELYDVTGATGGQNQCPGINWSTFGTPTSSSILSISQTDNRFAWVVAPGGQGTADWLFVWDKTLGCSSVNFNTGNVYAFTTSGSSATPALGQFSATGGTCWGSQGSTGAGIHDSQMTGDGLYVWASITGSNGAWQNGTCAGSVIGSQVSLWQIGTLGDVWLYNATSQAANTGPEFDNHPSAGVSNLLSEFTSNSDGFNTRSDSAVSAFTQFFPTPSNIQDQHCAQPHPLGDDSYPWVCASDLQLRGNNTGCVAPAQCPLVGQNVVFELNPNLPSTQKRVFFIPTYSCNLVTGGNLYGTCPGGVNDANFGPGSAIGYVTAQGNGFCWATSMFQTLALDNTNAPRSDLVCVALDVGNLARPAPVTQVLIAQHKSEPTGDSR